MAQPQSVATPPRRPRGEVAYFSMEIGLESSIPTYAGGLGVLAGDSARAAADLGLPLVALSLVHRQGYFRQSLDREGRQTELPDPWAPETRLEELPQRVRVNIAGSAVVVRAWRYWIEGVAGERVPVYLLDTRLPENLPEHQALTDHLYGGDERYRLCQEMVLGLGGVLMLEALGYEIRTFHMNEGHSALLALALLEQTEGSQAERIEAVRTRCVFTTHTPIPAGHDQFDIRLARELLGAEATDHLAKIGCSVNGILNMTHLALFFSHHVNGVAMRHGQISRGMFPGYPIASITNGVHAATWVAPAFQKLYDLHIADWREQNDNLRYAVGIPLGEIQLAHLQCKSDLLDHVRKTTGQELSELAFTLGFARRATAYKRADLLLADPERLAGLARLGPLQILYAGKAHPRDDGGKDLIRRVFEYAARLAGRVSIIYLEDYDMDLARLMCAGVDLWVNTPQKPHEASGTSGMKAALNGVPSLSVLDGWWIEGHVEGVTGWSIGNSWEPESAVSRELEMVYEKLELILRDFHARPESYVQIMRQAISLNGSFFNAERMLEQYTRSAYRRARGARSALGLPPPEVVHRTAADGVGTGPA